MSSTATVNVNGLVSQISQMVAALQSDNPDKVKQVAESIRLDASSLLVTIDDEDLRPRLVQPDQASATLELKDPPKNPASFADKLDMSLSKEIASESAVAFLMGQMNQNVINAVAGSRAQLSQNLEDREALHKQRIQELEKARERLNSAKAGQTTSRIFGWASCIGLGILGGLLIASGIGAGAGVGMIAAGGALVAGSAVAAVDQISQMTGDWLANGIADIAKSCGMDENAAKIFSRILIAATILTLTIAGGVGASVSMNGAAIASESLNTAQTVTQYALAGSSLAMGITDIVTAFYKYSSGEHNANSMELRARIQRVVFHNQAITEDLAELVKKAQKGYEIASSVIKERQEIKQQLLQFQAF